MFSLPHSQPMRLRGCTLLRCIFVSLLSISHAANAAPIDEFRISDIEQKIRDLETTTREQARLIAQLQSQAGGNGNVSAPTASADIPPNSEQRWLNASNWARLKIGMNELQIIELLGIPTQIRVSDDGQTRSLLYAMEIGRSGFLSGKVDLLNRKASNIEPPQLK